MFLLTELVCICIITFSVYLIVTSFIVSPNRRTDKIIKGMRNGVSDNTPGGINGRAYIESDWKRKVTVFVAKIIRIRPERKEKITFALERTGIYVTAEEFYAEALINGAIFFVCAFVFFLLGLGVAAFSSCMLGLLIFLRRINDMDNRLKKIKIEIADELPRFISVINYSLSTTRDLLKIFEKYLNICKPALKPDLQLLIAEMKSGNYAEALKRFDMRIGIPQLSAFVSGLIDSDRGIDQRTFFYLMEENMNALFIENKKKELAKRPRKIKKAIVSVGICLFALYLVPIGLQLIEGLDMFK